MQSLFESWIRRLHTYAGLYFLSFIWLFTASGLILNHPRWKFAEFWPQRQQSTVVRPFRPPPVGEDAVESRAVMAQLGIRGEVDGQADRESPTRMKFRSVRPGEITEITADRATGMATVSRVRVNGWGVINMLHSFTGVRRSDPSRHQNWWATGMWRVSMDALSIGLVFMVLSGVCVWYYRTQHRFGGIVALLLGIVAAGYFIS